MKNALKLTLIASSIALFSYQVQAQQQTPTQAPPAGSMGFQQNHQWNGNGQQNGGGRGQEIREKIDALALTQDQKERIHQIHEDIRTKYVGKEEEIKTQHENFMTLTPADDSYEKEVKKEASRIAGFTEERILLMGHVKKEIFGILNPTQQQQVVHDPFILDVLAMPHSEPRQGDRGEHGGQDFRNQRGDVPGNGQGMMRQNPPPGQGFVPPQNGNPN